MASSLILLGVTCTRHIPYFAIGYPRSRENRVEHLDLGTALARLVGRRCAAWVKARAESDRVELIRTRNYIPPQTTFHATWLRFGDEAVCSEFLDAYPQHRLDGRLANIAARREVLAVQVQHRLSRGDFNLGRIGDERQRENLARRYVETADNIRALSSELTLVDLARELAERWECAL